MRWVLAYHCGTRYWLCQITRSNARQAGSSSAWVLALTMLVMSASTAALRTPAKLPESSVAAAWLPNMSANSWPGLCVPW